MTTSQNINIAYAAQEVEAEKYEELDFLSEKIEIFNNDIINFKHIPVGIYRGHIIESEKQISSQKHTPFVKILIKVCLNDGSSTHIKSNFFCWLPKNTEQEKRNRLKLQKIMNMYIGGNSKNIGLLKGKEAFIAVYKKISKNIQYADTMEVSGWYPNEEDALKNGVILNNFDSNQEEKSIENTLDL